MKDWQKGYELDYLKGMESRWERYNSYSKSPFTEQRKDKIAKGLAEESLVVTDNYVFETKKGKTEVPVKMFRDVVIAKKEITLTKKYLIVFIKYSPFHQF